MIPKYDAELIKRVVADFVGSSAPVNESGKCYSLTARKRLVAKGAGIKLSDVDKILYGRHLVVEDISDIQVQIAAKLYNTRKDWSVKKLSEHLTERFRTKVSRDKLYKMLYETSNSRHYVEWRGEPKAIARYHSRNLEAEVEQPVPVKLDGIAGQETRKYGFLNYSNLRHVGGAVAAGVAEWINRYSPKAKIKSYFGYIENSRIIRAIKSRGTRHVRLEEL